MKKLILASLILFAAHQASADQALLAKSVGIGSSAPVAIGSAKPSAGVKTSGQVEVMEATENEALVKLKGVKKMFVIQAMTDFSPAQLNKLTESKATGKEVQLKVDGGNKIIAIEGK